MLPIERTMPKKISQFIKSLIMDGLRSIWLKSLKAAGKEQRLEELANKLKDAVPDIDNQYSALELNNIYLRTKVRYQHAFQVSLIDRIIREFDKPVIIDIGDSAGTHLQYIIKLYAQGNNITCYSVNSDAKAVERIRKKSLNAILAKAEDLDSYNIAADIFLCFQTLEHLMDPCNFLHRLSSKTMAKYLIITVPYLKRSRVGLYHARGWREGKVTTENTHFLELNPEDWRTVFKHSGWNIVSEKVYLQYPRKNILRLTRFLWKRLDFEGFYGAILKKDTTWSSKYTDWQVING